jgi:hypothetical protein
LDAPVAAGASTTLATTRGLPDTAPDANRDAPPPRSTEFRFLSENDGGRITLTDPERSRPHRPLGASFRRDCLEHLVKNAFIEFERQWQVWTFGLGERAKSVLSATRGTVRFGQDLVRIGCQVLSSRDHLAGSTSA